MRTFLILAALVAVSGCTDSVLVLRDPRSGQVVQCQGSGPWPVRQNQAEQCADGYQRAGFVKL
jgi:hypothetical protein